MKRTPMDPNGHLMDTGKPMYPNGVLIDTRKLLNITP